MKKIFKQILLLIGIALLWSDSKAQDGIDTALFKHYKVKKMWVYVKLPIFANRTYNDSCLVESYNFDSSSRIISQKNNRTCYGWDGSFQSFNTYDSLGKLKLTKNIANDEITFTHYLYNLNNDIIKIVQLNPQTQDSFITLNNLTYNKDKLIKEMKVFEAYKGDTNKFVVQYKYDEAKNVKTCWNYTWDMKLIKKETYDITPISKKLLEYTAEIKLPKESYSKTWNFYNFNSQLYRTQYSNNTWTEFVYKENGLLDQTLSYNMEGKLNSWKRYFYEFYEGTE